MAEGLLFSPLSSSSSPDESESEDEELDSDYPSQAPAESSESKKSSELLIGIFPVVFLFCSSFYSSMLLVFPLFFAFIAAFFDLDLLCVKIVASICCTLHSFTYVSSLPLANRSAFVEDQETEFTI